MAAVDYALVDSAKGEIATVVDRIQTILSKVQDTVEAGKKGFQGQAAGAFQAACVTWDEEGVRLKKVLKELEDQVGVGQTTYSNLEQESGEGFAKVTNGLTNL